MLNGRWLPRRSGGSRVQVCLARGGSGLAEPAWSSMTSDATDRNRSGFPRTRSADSGGGSGSGPTRAAHRYRNEPCRDSSPQCGYARLPPGCVSAGYGCALYPCPVAAQPHGRSPNRAVASRNRAVTRRMGAVMSRPGTGATDPGARIGRMSTRAVRLGPPAVGPGTDKRRSGVAIAMRSPRLASIKAIEISNESAKSENATTLSPTVL
jgi:hypothetical protein